MEEEQKARLRRMEEKSRELDFMIENSKDKKEALLEELRMSIYMILLKSYLS